MTTAPLVVLQHEGPIGRAYLTCLRRMGLRPATLILMVYEATPANDKQVGRWWPKKMRMAYAERMQDIQLNYWGRQLRKEFAGLVARMTHDCCDAADFCSDFHDEMYNKRWKYEDYAGRVRRVMVSGLGDSKLIDVVSGAAPAVVLYTGGGIVPQSLLSIAGARYLHIHPGVLPDVRGADGLLWSMLVRKRPAATCIYMAPGIDQGEVICTQEFEPLSFKIPYDEHPEDQDLYRAVYAYYDPIIRSRLLRSVFRLGADLGRFASKPQQDESAVTYRFMHPLIRQAALSQIFHE